MFAASILLSLITSYYILYELMISPRLWALKKKIRLQKYFCNFFLSRQGIQPTHHLSNMPRNLAYDKEQMRLKRAHPIVKPEFDASNEKIFKTIEDMRATMFVISLQLDDLVKNMEALEENGLDDPKYDVNFSKYFYHHSTQVMLERANIATNDAKGFLGEFRDRMHYMSQGYATQAEILSYLKADGPSHEFFNRTV